jgi:hypothetical protein
MEQYGWKSNCPTFFNGSRLYQLSAERVKRIVWWLDKSIPVGEQGRENWTEAFVLAQNLTHNFLLSEEFMYSRKNHGYLQCHNVGLH